MWNELIANLEVVNHNIVNNYFVHSTHCPHIFQKLFLTQEEAERDTIPADEGIHPNSDMDADSSNFNNTVCIVCRSLPVTRALLPCRHACICGLCFGKINLCPMCRAGIQSFFRLQDEPFLPGDEPSVSAELGQLSSWELIRAIFSAD